MNPEEIKIDAYYQVYRYDSYGEPLADRVHHIVYMDTNTSMVWYHVYDLRGCLLLNGNTQYSSKKHFVSRVKNRVKPSTPRRRKNGNRYYNKKLATGRRYS